MFLSTVRELFSLQVTDFEKINKNLFFQYFFETES